MLEVAGGRLFVHGLSAPQVAPLARAAHVAEAALVAAVDGRDGPIDPAVLPAVQFTPAGAPLTGKHQGRPG